LSLTIPVAVVGDVILGKENKSQAMLGALLVLLSFVIVGLENAKQGEGEDEFHAAPFQPEESRSRSTRPSQDLSPHAHSDQAAPLTADHF